ncbi:hypothetical protein ACIF6L_26535 [Kitasatospora sp. NPDC086009]|uniref:hypothetical protein n=1 Tax=unclassified Kitasatospora TaxID=2633591 RepID=UPI0037C62407
MYLFSRTHTLNEELATSGRSAIAVGATHKQPISDTVLIRVFHPTTGAGRSFVLTRDEVSQLHDALSQWLVTGWAGFVDGAPEPGQGAKYSAGTSGSGADIWEALERRRLESAEQQRKADEALANTYASWTREELVAEIKLQKLNRESAETRAQRWRDVADAEQARVRALFGRLRAVLKGKRTASVDDLNAALKEES